MKEHKNYQIKIHGVGIIQIRSDKDESELKQEHESMHPGHKVEVFHLPMPLPSPKKKRE